METLSVERHHPIWRLCNLPQALATLIPNVNKSLDELFRQCFGNNPEPPRILRACLLYYSDDPHHIALPLFAAAQGSFHRGGRHYLKGGAQHLSDTLAGIITAHG